MATFALNSRYAATLTSRLTLADGTEIVYLRRRFVPQAASFDLLVEHTVVGGERVDIIASQYLNDPELYWRLCDANNALWPGELTETAGRKLRITLPEGIPGPLAE
jgi:hypothetical protein